MDLVDTHCHIHEAVYAHELNTETRKRYEKAGQPSPNDMLASAAAEDVNRVVCIGTTLEDSEIAAAFAKQHDNVWASIGLHPHEAKDYAGNNKALRRFAALASQKRVVAVGECGLDYYYNHSLKADQETVLRFQIELALEHGLAMSFHVRDAFDDFWPIFDSYQDIRGVIHSFTATQKELDQVLERGLYVGLNGITTFTDRQQQIDAIKAVPLEKMVLETDAPFLTPTPYRGNICEPKHIRVTAAFLAELRGEPLEELARRTTENAESIFGLR
ncbi:MAG TPA: TatD family hydrolase [Candidatus Saccharimonadales bacterium]|nr:TatD family hydrolase [Candidatus Saccharimonadales bacterium]